MGADGGTVPTRAELIKRKRKEERLEPLQIAQLKLSCCGLTGHALAKSPENLVCDARGNLFNMEAVLEAMLDSEKKLALQNEFGIKRMKDLIKVKATMNPEYTHVSEEIDTFIPPFSCPFTQDLSNGVIKFVIIRPCGHVLSLRALKELSDEPAGKSTDLHTSTTAKTSASEHPTGISSPNNNKAATSPNSAPTKCCLTCQTPYRSEDVIEIATDSAAPLEPTSSKKSKKRSIPTPSDAERESTGLTEPKKAKENDN